GAAGRGQPCAFDPGDPDLVAEGEPEPEAGAGERAPPADAAAAAVTRPTLAGLGRRGLRWGAVLVSALAGAAALSAGASFARLVSVALLRKDWIGRTALALLPSSRPAGPLMPLPRG